MERIFAWWRNEYVTGGDVYDDAELKSYPTPFFGSWVQLEVVLGKAINKMAQQIGVTGSYSKDPDLAVQLIKVMTSPDIQYQLFKLRAQQPVVLETFTKYPDAKAALS